MAYRLRAIHTNACQKWIPGKNNQNHMSFFDDVTMDLNGKLLNGLQPADCICKKLKLMLCRAIVTTYKKYIRYGIYMVRIESPFIRYEVGRVLWTSLDKREFLEYWRVEYEFRVLESFREWFHYRNRSLRYSIWRSSERSYRSEHEPYDMLKCFHNGYLYDRSK